MPAAVGQLHRLPSHAHLAACYSTSPIPMGRLLSSVYHCHQHIYHGCTFYQKMLHRTDLTAHFVNKSDVPRNYNDHRESTMKLHIYWTLPDFMTLGLYSYADMRRIYQRTIYNIKAFNG